MTVMLAVLQDSDKQYHPANRGAHWVTVGGNDKGPIHSFRYEDLLGN